MKSQNEIQKQTFCPICASKEKTIQIQQRLIEYQEKRLQLNKENNSMLMDICLQ